MACVAISPPLSRCRAALGVAVVGAVVGGCSFQVGAGGGTDGGADARLDAATDAPTDVVVPLGPWGTPALVPLVNGAFVEDDPSLTADQLELYFGSDRPGAGTLGLEDIWVTTRASITDPWGPPQPVTALNSSATETTMKVTADGLTIMFTSNRDLVGSDLYVATRASRQAAWSTPVVVPELSTTASDYAPHLTDDGRRVILSSFLDGDEDLYVSTRGSTAVPWPTPVQVTELSTLSTESDPMEPDAQTLYFTTGRDGTLDIYTAQRVGAGYGTAVPVTELNTPSIERDAWVSADQRTMYFSSNRGGDFDLYISTR